MARLKLENVIQVRLTNRVVERLDQMADDYETTRSDIIRRMLVENTRREEPQVATTNA